MTSATHGGSAAGAAEVRLVPVGVVAVAVLAGSSTGTVAGRSGTVATSGWSAALGSCDAGGAVEAAIVVVTATLSPALNVVDGVGAAAAGGAAAGVGFRGPGAAGASLLRPKFGLIWIRERLVDIAAEVVSRLLAPSRHWKDEDAVGLPLLGEFRDERLYKGSGPDADALERGYGGMSGQVAVTAVAGEFTGER